MIFSALNKTWTDILHPTFRKIFIIAVVAATITLGFTSWAVVTFWPSDYSTGYDWIDNAGLTLIILISWYLLFPGLATTVISLFADQIIDTVEDKHYPHRKASRQASIGENILSSLKLTLFLIGVNLMALVPYIFLFIVTGGLGSFILFLVINGMLLGREYFEMVAIRHLAPDQVKQMRKRYSGKITRAGMVTSVLFLIPGVNVLGPIISASVMTHIVHKTALQPPRPKPSRGTRAELMGD